jgi:MoaA/NifB/PqqE/SkfB family radical SAM enzyme
MDSGLLVPSIDIYVTYRCNLRCAHCFVGDNLNLNTNFPLDSLMALIHYCHHWKTNQITFLGGEPTIYPSIVQVVQLAAARGLRSRLITNGQQGFAKFMHATEGVNVEIGFSIDGSSASVHDTIRGSGTFKRLLANVLQSQSLGFESHAIVSVSKQNCHDILRILDLCEQLRFKYVNVHYVTARGFASSDIVLKPPAWRKLCFEVRDYSSKLNVEVRLEETFVTKEQGVGSCAVRERSSLLFFPDGRVFMCPMFIDVPDAHSFIWSGSTLLKNRSKSSETVLSAADVSVHCPAMRFVNPTIAKESASLGLSIRCIFHKTELGLTS